MNKEYGKTIMLNFLISAVDTLKNIDLSNMDDCERYIDIQTKKVLEPKKIYCLNYCFVCEDKEERDKLFTLLESIYKEGKCLVDLNKKVRIFSMNKKC